jgi:hypothetical protein
MRWFRRTPAGRSVDLDPARQEALVQEIRHRFGAGVRIPYRDQVHALRPVLDGDLGLLVAARIVRDMAEEANIEILRRYAMQGRNYRALWRQVGPALRSPLFALPGGFHPYVHLAAALGVIGANARRCVRLTDPNPLQARLLELLDLTVSGWEFGRVPVDPDAATLASGLISTTQHLRTAMPDEPPPLSPAIREMMRRNNTTHVYDPAGRAVIGGINVGAEMRPAFLI